MSTQATRAGMLAAQFEATAAQFKDTVTSVPDEKWKAQTPADGRPVNVVAHHAAVSHAQIAGLVRAIADGQGTPLTMEQIHAGNAEHARQFAGCSKTETLETHDRGSAEASAIVSGLTDEQLAQSGEFLAGRPMTVEQAIEGILIGHPREHMATIQAALA